MFSLLKSSHTENCLFFACVYAVLKVAWAEHLILVHMHDEGALRSV